MSLALSTPTSRRLRENWRSDAACLKESAEIPEMGGAWDSPGHPYFADAQLICEVMCKVRQFCGRDAIEDPDSVGLRAGFMFTDGKVDRSDAKHLAKALGLPVESIPKKNKKTRTDEIEEEDLL